MHLGLVCLENVSSSDVERDGGLGSFMQLPEPLLLDPVPHPLPVPPCLRMPAHARMLASQRNTKCPLAELQSAKKSAASRGCSPRKVQVEKLKTEINC